MRRCLFRLLACLTILNSQFTRIFVGLVTGLLFSSFVQAEPTVVKIGIVLPEKHAIPEYVSRALSSPNTEIVDFVLSSPRPMNRGAIELLVLLKALHLGGLEFTPEFQRMPVQARTIEAMKAGKLHLSSETLWVDELKEQGHALDVSQSIIGYGAIKKGIYLREDALSVLGEVDDYKLKTLKIAIVKSWALDIQTLVAAGFRNLVFVNSHRAMYEVTALGRADATLLSFSSAPDFVRTATANNQQKISLYPIPGVTLGIPDSRAFVLSRTAPNMAKIAQALDRGVKILHASGEIRKAFEAAGIYNARVKHWRSF